MKQLEIIEKVKEISLADKNVSAVLMYGSFIRGEGDEYSDVEFYVYLHDKSGFNSPRWVDQIRSVAMFFTSSVHEHSSRLVVNPFFEFFNRFR